MRYMIIVKGTPEDEQQPPSSELIAEMGRFNQTMMDAGVWLTGEGLRESKHGAIVKYNGKQQTVVDGPFTEAKELVGGFWIIQVSDLAEAVSWARRIPFESGEVEVRRVTEVSDFVRDDVSAPALDAEQAARDSGKW